MDPSQARDPSAAPDHAPEKQSELKLNVGIGVIGTVLSLFVTIVFFTYVGSPLLGTLFAVVAVAAAAVTIYAYLRKKRARENS